MDITTALTRLGGVSDRAAILRLVTRSLLDAGLRSGEVIRVAHNLYALPVADDAAVVARRVHGVVSHLSAALAWGWKVKCPPARPTVTVGRSRHPGAKAGVRYAVLTADDVVDGRTTPIRTAVDCARALPFDEALSVLDSALRSERVTREELVSAASAGPRTGRTRALRAIAVASGEAANPFESTLRAVSLGVPGLSPIAQCPVGSIGHADVGDPCLRIAIEAESFEFHALPEAFRYDIRRYTAMAAAGWLVVRFVWEDVMHRPAYIAGTLAEVVSLRSNPRGGSSRVMSAS